MTWFGQYVLIWYKYWSNYVTCIPEFKGDVTEVILTLERRLECIPSLGQEGTFFVPS